MLKIFKHIIIWLLIVMPLTLIGVLVLPFVTYKYDLGKFPKYIRWFDDARAIRIVAGFNCAKFFGRGHCILFNSYNRSWKGRYIWSAFRNSTNYFQHYVIGKSQYDTSAWQTFKYIDIPKTDYKLRIRVGYKVERDKAHKRAMELLDIPAQWTFSIGIRAKDKQ